MLSLHFNYLVDHVNSVTSFCAVNFGRMNPVHFSVWFLLIRHDSSQCDSIWCDPNWRDSNFCARIFQLRKYSHAHRFWKFYRVRGFQLSLHRVTATCSCWKIQPPPEGEFETTLPDNLWELTSDISRWVQPDDVITTPPKSLSLHFRSPIQTSD